MVIDDIHELLTAPSPADAALFLEQLDSTLTAGYAHALQLEAERWRLERRIGEVAANIVDEKNERETNELASLARRLTAANENISALRTLLGSLRERRSAIRTAAAA
jgi:ABC-type phosphate transport system auxiliary subunit